MAPDAADGPVKGRAEVEVLVRMGVGDRKPRLETVAFATVAEVGEFVLVRVRMTSLGGACQTRIESRMGVGRRRASESRDEERGDDGNHNGEREQRRCDPACVPPCHAALQAILSPTNIHTSILSLNVMAESSA